MYYVYILKSINYNDQIYIGFTKNLETPLIKHNNDNVVYTRKYVPWEIAAYTALKTKEQAIHFEKHLKSGSGRVFLQKRFL